MRRIRLLVLDTDKEFLETACMLLDIRRPAFCALAVLACAIGMSPGQSRERQPSDYLLRSATSGSRGGNLVASITEDPATFNRMFTTGLANAMVAEQISADLVHINRITYEVEPSLATRWEVSRDGRTYTIHLRRGICFSDGSPFSAEDVVFTFDVLRNPKTVSIMADQIQVDGKFPEISQIDPSTIRLAWPRPVGTGLRALDSVPILPKRRLKQAFGDGLLAASWGPTVSPNQVVGLGPFRLKEYQRGSRVILERNPYYWKKDKTGQILPYLDLLTFIVIPDRNAAALRFQAGEIDILNTMSAELFATLRRSKNASEFTLRDLGTGLGMDFLWFNLNPGQNAAGTPFLDPQKRALFEKPAFRQSVSCALDRAGIVQSTLLGLGTPQYGAISSGNKVWYHQSLQPVLHDPLRARSLLAQLGLKDNDGDGILEFGAPPSSLDITVITGVGNPARERAAEIIRQNLGQIGIRAKIQLLLPNELIARFLRTYEYEAVLFGNTPSDVVPDLQADLWYSNGTSHFWYPNQTSPNTSWEAEIDSLTSQLLQSLDPAVRMNAFRKIQEIWLQQLPAIPTVAPNILSGWRNTIGNVRPSILPFYLLWNSEELTKRAR